MTTGQFSKFTHFSQLPQQLISYQQYDNLRLQRLRQQRKRMETMYEIIVQQKNKIDCYQQDISSQDQKIQKIKKQSQSLKQSLIFNQRQKEQFKQIIMKQEIVIRSFKNILSDSKQLSLFQKEEIFQASGYREWETLTYQIENFQKLNYNQFKSEWKNDVSSIGIENDLRLQLRMGQQKYEQLCQDYRQLTKHSKTLELQLMKIKYENTPNNGQQNSFYKEGHSKRLECSQQKNNQSSAITNKKHKHCHTLHMKIQKLQSQITICCEQNKKKNILLDKYHETEDQHHKLIGMLKKKLKEALKMNHLWQNSQSKNSHVIVSAKNMQMLSPQKSAELDINILKSQKSKIKQTLKQKGRIVASSDQKQNLMLKKTANTTSKVLLKDQKLYRQSLNMNEN